MTHVLVSFLRRHRVALLQTPTLKIGKSLAIAQSWGARGGGAIETTQKQVSEGLAFAVLTMLLAVGTWAPIAPLPVSMTSFRGCGT